MCFLKNNELDKAIARLLAKSDYYLLEIHESLDVGWDKLIPAINRLERFKLVKWYYGTIDFENRIKFYTLTEEGKEILNGSRSDDRWERLYRVSGSRWLQNALRNAVGVGKSLLGKSLSKAD